MRTNDRVRREQHLQIDHGRGNGSPTDQSVFYKVLANSRLRLGNQGDDDCYLTSSEVTSNSPSGRSLPLEATFNTLLCFLYQSSDRKYARLIVFASQYFYSRAITLGPQVLLMVGYLTEISHTMKSLCVKESEDPVSK
jgi:hypothetical protein